MYRTRPIANVDSWREEPRMRMLSTVKGTRFSPSHTVRVICNNIMVSYTACESHYELGISPNPYPTSSLIISNAVRVFLILNATANITKQRDVSQSCPNIPSQSCTFISRPFAKMIWSLKLKRKTMKVGQGGTEDFPLYVLGPCTMMETSCAVLAKYDRRCVSSSVCSSS